MRKIIHMDIDAFFAQVEQLDNPKWRNKPLIVGGNSERGVVATCSYEARQYGVRSAMSSVVAKKLCPHAIFVNGNMNRYVKVSKLIFGWIKEHFDHFEQVSIDEAYIEVTDATKDPVDIAKQLKRDVFALTGLTISVGVSYNKFLAKLASEWNKPDGLFVISEESMPELLFPLKISKVHGLGKKSCEKFNRLGIFTVGDLYVYPESIVYEIIGEAWGREIIQYIHGIDNRPVHSHHERKSYGKEVTLESDTEDRLYLLNTLEGYLDRICQALTQKKIIAKTLTIKIKYCDFEQFTKSYSLEHPTMQVALWHQALERTFESIELKKPVRLIGITLSNFQSEAVEQLNWFGL